MFWHKEFNKTRKTINRTMTAYIEVLGKLYEQQTELAKAWEAYSEELGNYSRKGINLKTANKLDDLFHEFNNCWQSQDKFFRAFSKALLATKEPIEKTHILHTGEFIAMIEGWREREKARREGQQQEGRVRKARIETRHKKVFFPELEKQKKD